MEKFNFKLNGKTFSSDEGTISGGQILEIGGFLPLEDFNLFMKRQHQDAKNGQIDHLTPD